MGCLKLTYQNNTKLKLISCTKELTTNKSKLKAPNTYLYGYQGQYSEFDPETSLNHFELRNYGSRIGRWTATDPYRQYYSPYTGMGNNPVSRVDPDGGCATGDTPCIQAAQAAGFTSQSDINAFLNADITVNAAMPFYISGYNRLIAGLYASDAWMAKYQGEDKSMDGLYGIEFYSTTDINGVPSYWLRSGKAEYAIEDAGFGLAVFKGGNGSSFKLDLKTPNSSSNINTIKQATTLLSYGTKTAKILTSVLNQTIKVHGSPAINNNSEYNPDTTFWTIQNPSHRVDGMTINGVDTPGDTIWNNQ